MSELTRPLRGLVGAKSATALRESLGIETVGDLLGHYPRRLEDRGKLTDFSDLPLGEHVTVLAKTVEITTRPYAPKHGGRRGTRTEVRVTDGTRELVCTFFRQPWRGNQLRPGTVALFSGKVVIFSRRRELQHPTCEVLGHGSDLGEFGDELADADPLPRWLPIYPASAKITSKVIGECVDLVLPLVDAIPDPLPEPVRAEHRFPPYADALRAIHRPADPEDWEAARRRLRYDEAFLLQGVLARRRRRTEQLSALPRPARAGGLLDRFDAALPFRLTAGQQQVAGELEADLSGGHPMHRLLQGEVGSGKTVVALRAMLQVVDAGGQAALLAPTEVLAAQHLRSITALLGPLGEGGLLGGADEATRVTLLTGSTSAARRRAALSEVASGAAGVVIGTHALLEESVQFAELGLVVVDEQHRFGVEQRAALTTKAGEGTSPHVLVMTATPIPRTVAMTVFGDLDVSTLRELPAGRAGVQSTVVPAAERPEWLRRTWQRVREEVDAGRQAYVVCPRIGGEPEAELARLASPDDDEAAGRRPPVAVADVAADLVSGPLAGLRVFMLHGRQPAEEKDDLMRRFAAGDIDVLVATTVIEVGVDVPNATVMVVMDAERFGVSQLHQLRGRVGRGTSPGLCLLVTDADAGSRSRERLDKVADSVDGFALARLDLEHRREGDVLGAAQSGRRSSLRLLSVLQHEDVIATARAAVEDLMARDPCLEQHPALAAALVELERSDSAGYLEKS